MTITKLDPPTVGLVLVHPTCMADCNADFRKVTSMSLIVKYLTNLTYGSPVHNVIRHSKRAQTTYISFT